MSDAALEQAYELIEQGDREAAREILDDIKEKNEANIDFWWIYAHAQEDADAGREALDRILEINPNYLPARNLSRQITQDQVPSMSDVEVSSKKSEASQKSVPAPAKDDWKTPTFDEPSQESGERSSTGLIAALGIFLIVVIGIGFVLLNQGATGGNNNDTGAVTQDAQAAASTDEAAASSLADLSSSLATFEVPSDGIQITETRLGTTVNVRTCAEPGTAESNAISGISDVLANNLDVIPEDADAISFAIVNCADDTVIREVGFGIQALNDYAAGDLTLSELQSQLRPIG